MKYRDKRKPKLKDHRKFYFIVMWTLVVFMIFNSALLAFLHSSLYYWNQKRQEVFAPFAVVIAILAIFAGVKFYQHIAKR